MCLNLLIAHCHSVRGAGLERKTLTPVKAISHFISEAEFLSFQILMLWESPSGIPLIFYAHPAMLWDWGSRFSVLLRRLCVHLFLNLHDLISCLSTILNFKLSEKFYLCVEKRKLTEILKGWCIPTHNTLQRGHLSTHWQYSGRANNMHSNCLEPSKRKALIFMCCSLFRIDLLKILNLFLLFFLVFKFPEHLL